MICSNCKKIEHSFKEKPFCPHGGYKAGKNNIHQCVCGQRWFCYNDYYCLWGRVEDDLTWKFLVRNVDVPISIGSVCKVIPGYEKYDIDPVHEICKENVYYPKITQPLEGLREAEKFQWFGEYLDGNIFNYQFSFPIIAPSGKFRTNLWLFKIPFIGKIKEWPNLDQQSGIAESFDDPKMEKYIAHLMSSAFPHDYGNGKLGPISFVVEIILLADPNVGIIKPRYFCDQRIVDMVNDDFMEKNPA